MTFLLADLDGGEDESYANEMDGLEDELAADMDEGQFKASSSYFAKHPNQQQH